MPRVPLLEPVTGLLRGTLRAAERMGGAPIRDVAEAEHEAADLAEAMHRAADSAERHIDSVDHLAAAVPALTDAVNQLTETLNGLLGVLGPLAGAEREVSRLGHLFGGHREEPKG